MRITAFRGFLLAQGVIVAALSLAPDDSWVHVLGRVLAGWSAVAAVVVGLRRHRPPAAAAYYLFGLGVFLNVGGTLVEKVVNTFDPEASPPTLAEPFWLAIYPSLIAGMILLIRRRAGRQLSSLVDSAIITVGLGLLAWVFMIRPQALHAETSLLARAVQTAYPLADLAVLALMVRLLIGGGSRSLAFRLMIAALLGLLGGDLAWAIASAVGLDPGPVARRALAGIYQMAYALVGAAALHPSVRELATPSPREARLGPGLLLGMAAASLVAPALLMLETARGHVADGAAIAVSSTVLFLLVVVRMSELVRRVEDRTGELAGRNRSTRMVLDTINEGLLRVARDGTLLEERSAMIDRWFGPFTAGTPFADYVARLDPAFADGFRLGHEAWLDGTLPEELCLEQLPHQLRAGERHFKVSYLPVRDGTAAQAGLLLVIDDVSDQRQLAQQEAEQRELLAVFQGFARDRVGLLAMFEEVTRMIERAPNINPDSTTHRRLLHTVKGNTALAGLSLVASLAHAAESELEESGAPGPAFAALHQRWQALREALRELSAGRSDGIEVPKPELERLEQELAHGLPVARAIERLRWWQCEPVERPLARLGHHARALARRLDKGELAVEVEAGELRLETSRWRTLWAELVHVVNNAVDHGIEGPEERRARGKGKPRLSLRARLDERGLEVEVEDDGRGIDWDAIRRAAGALRLPTETPEQLTAALLSPGVSSRAEADMISGRGLGMASVEARLRGLEGAIAVDSRPGQGTRVRLSFPLSTLSAAERAGADALLAGQRARLVSA
jgi:HPt (histidine-containing phosphotransfer) domain-containing protein